MTRWCTDAEVRRDTQQHGIRNIPAFNTTTAHAPRIPDLANERIAWLLPNMRSTSLFTSCIAALSGFACADLNLSEPLRSKQVLPSTFTPPQVFKNANLVRITNLDKAYPRETINVIIENIDSKPQSEYYVPFETSLLSKVGGFEVRDKKAADKGMFKAEVVGLDTER